MSRRKRPTKTSSKKTSSGSPRASSYQTQPKLPASVAHRVEVVNKVMAEQITVTEGAKLLGISRVQMQNLKNRALVAVAEVMTQHKGGRPPKDEVQQLEDEIEILESRNDELKDELSRTTAALGDLLDINRAQTSKIRGLERKILGRSSRRSRRKRQSDEDDSDARTRLARAHQLRKLGVGQPAAARAVGTSPSTLRRWARRLAEDKQLVERRGPGPKRAPTATERRKVEARVRKLNGVIGAAPLGKATGVSRRDAAVIKAQVLTQMERERQEAAGRVEVLEPGVMRGLDGMHFTTCDGKAYGLFVTDSAVPFRTSAELVEHYDGEAVTRIIDADFREHGPPLVFRLDQASCHKTAQVREVLDAHGVLHLHGPAYHAQYYGQLERQNREHRQVLGPDLLPKATLRARLRPMCTALNDLYPRRSLGWRTSSEAWNARRPITIDRTALREQVVHRVARIQAAAPEPLAEELTWRLAVQQTLIQHGLLRITPGGGC